MLIYISGPYNADSEEKIEKNVRKAEDLALELIKRTSHYPICPHTMTKGWEKKISLDDIMRSDFEAVKKCDALLMLEGWEKSRGAKLEKKYAGILDKPIYYSIDEIPKDPYPLQFAQFDRLLHEMAALHRGKNRDYSAQNISVTGEIGLFTRLLDKVCRLASLLGWDIVMKFRGKNEPKEAKYESIVDTYKDLAVYSLIGIILRNRKWGK